jgi:hypothetical protein
MDRAISWALVVAGALASFGCQPVESPTVPLVTDEYFITGIAVDEFSLYFIKQDGSLKSVPLDGGPTRELATGITDPRHIVLSEDAVYLGTSLGTVAWGPKAGGAAEPLIEGEPDIMGLAVDKTHVYFTAGDRIQAVSLADAVQEALVEDQIYPDTLAQSGGFLHWSGGPAYSSVQRVSVAGGTVASLAVAPSRIVAIGADPSFVYWSRIDPELGVGTLSRALPDGADERVIATDQAEIFRIVGDQDNVYWSSHVDGSLSMAPTDGGAQPYAFSFGPSGPVFLAQDEAFLYYARYEAGNIYARPKTSLAQP